MGMIIKLTKLSLSLGLAVAEAGRGGDLSTYRIITALTLLRSRFDYVPLFCSFQEVGSCTGRHVHQVLVLLDPVTAANSLFHPSPQTIPTATTRGRSARHGRCYLVAIAHSDPSLAFSSLPVREGGWVSRHSRVNAWVRALRVHTLHAR